MEPLAEPAEGSLAASPGDEFLDCNSPPGSPGPAAGVEVALGFLEEHLGVIVCSYCAPTVFEDFISQALSETDRLALLQLMRGIAGSLTPDQKQAFGDVVLGQTGRDSTAGRRGGLLQGDTQLLRQFLQRNQRLSDYLCLTCQNPFTTASLTKASAEWCLLHPPTAPSEAELQCKGDGGRVRVVDGVTRVRGSCAVALRRNMPPCLELEAFDQFYEALLRASADPGLLGTEVAQPLLNQLSSLDPRMNGITLLDSLSSKATGLIEKLHAVTHATDVLDPSGPQIQLLKAVQTVRLTSDLRSRERLAEMEGVAREGCMSIEAKAFAGITSQALYEREGDDCEFADCIDEDDDSQGTSAVRVVYSASPEFLAAAAGAADVHDQPSPEEGPLLTWLDEFASVLSTALEGDVSLQHVVRQLQSFEGETVRELTRAIAETLSHKDVALLQQALRDCAGVRGTCRLTDPQGDCALEIAQTICLELIRSSKALCETLTTAALDTTKTARLQSAARSWEQIERRALRPRRPPNSASPVSRNSGPAAPAAAHPGPDPAARPRGHSATGQRNLISRFKNRSSSLLRRAAAAVIEPPSPP
eukprot:TRINITY_DN3810_c0_g1_i1.p1 TRINITY_DN3810_c0_g1~~TRINITY_DN3810_c0_g1_i1.p1  ORF type:complete len:589 (+),score=103.85 TRINITY_DN3810_c0_g1_i1:81-1847(+)